MDRLRPYPVAAFSGVTLLIWGNRIWLAWTDAQDSVARKVFWSVPITAFVVAAVVVAVALAAGVDRSATWFTTTVKAFAGGTIAFWAVRAPMILLADHGVGFKVVHAVLAAASVASAVLAWRSIDRVVAAPGDRAATEPPARVAGG